MSRVLVAFAAIVAAHVPRFAAAQQPGPKVEWVQGGEYRLKGSVFPSADLSQKPILVVVLHGDSPFSKPDYQDRFAAEVAAHTKDVVVVALLRPGYTDPQGNTSEGERGQTTGDNYNVRNTDAIAAAIAELKRRYHSRKVVVAGHSGGAAITANILGRHPDLIDAALVVSCPCDVTRWREHMFEVTKFAGFQGRIETLSPIEQVNGVSDHATITLMVGDQDEVAPPDLSEAWRAAAVKLGKKVRLVRLPGEGHEIFLKPAVQTELATLLR